MKSCLPFHLYHVLQQYHFLSTPGKWPGEGGIPYWRQFHTYFESYYWTTFLFYNYSRRHSIVLEFPKDPGIIFPRLPCAREQICSIIKDGRIIWLILFHWFSRNLFFGLSSENKCLGYWMASFFYISSYISEQEGSFSGMRIIGKKG